MCGRAAKYHMKQKTNDKKIKRSFFEDIMSEGKFILVSYSAKRDGRQKQICTLFGHPTEM